MTTPRNTDEQHWLDLMDRRESSPIFEQMCFDRWQAELAAGEGVE